MLVYALWWLLENSIVLRTSWLPQYWIETKTHATIGDIHIVLGWLSRIYNFCNDCLKNILLVRLISIEKHISKLIWICLIRTPNEIAEFKTVIISSFKFGLVGMTGFEPATTRPPGEYSTGLSYIPIFAVVNIWLSTRSSVKMMDKASKFLILWLN